MNIKKIASFFGIKKPFKISEEELEHINSGISFNEHIVDLDFADHDTAMSEEILINIYEDAQFLFDYNHSNLEQVIFNSLEHHRYLLASHPEIKKEVLFYIFKDSSRKRISRSSIKIIDSIPQDFKNTIGYHLMNSKLRLTDKDLTYFFNAWKNTYPNDYPIRPLIRQLEKYTSKNEISSKLKTNLHSFLLGNSIQYLSIQQYMDTKSSVHRVILENSLTSLTPPCIFQLLPDPFGFHVNKLISNMSKKYQQSFSNILSILRYKISSKAIKQIDTYLEPINQGKFDDFIYDILRRAAHLRIRNVALREKVEHAKKDRIYGTNEHVYKENINLIKGLIQLQGHRKNLRSIELITIILKRCFAVSSGSNYGPTSQSLGIVCIQTLTYQFEEPGKTELIDIYQKTSFKLIKKQIEMVSKKLKIETGTSLL